LIISSLKLGNAISIYGQTHTYWDSNKGYRITLEKNQIMIKVVHIKTGAWTMTTVFNVIELKTPDGDIRATPVPTYTHGEDDPGAPDEQQPVKLDANGRPIPRYGDRRPDGPMHVAASLQTPDDDWKPEPVPKFEDRQRKKNESADVTTATATDVKKGKGTKVNAAGAENTSEETNQD
jgi:hypothetical protein